MKNKSTNQVVTFGMKMNPVSRFLTDETRNQNNDTMSNSEVRKMSSDKIKKISEQDIDHLQNQIKNNYMYTSAD